MPNVPVSIRPVFPVIQVALTQGTSAPATFTPAIPGAPGGAASISTDPGNAVSAGGDGGIYAPAAFTVAARFSEISSNETAKTEARQNLGLQDVDCGTFN